MGFATSGRVTKPFVYESRSAKWIRNIKSSNITNISGVLTGLAAATPIASAVAATLNEIFITGYSFSVAGTNQPRIIDVTIGTSTVISEAVADNTGVSRQTTMDAPFARV